MRLTGFRQPPPLRGLPSAAPADAHKAEFVVEPTGGGVAHLDQIPLDPAVLQPWPVQPAVLRVGDQRGGLTAQRVQYALQECRGLLALLGKVGTPLLTGHTGTRAMRATVLRVGLGACLGVDLGLLDQAEEEARIRHPLPRGVVPAAYGRQAGLVRQRGGQDGHGQVFGKPGRAVLAALHHPDSGVLKSVGQVVAECVLRQYADAELTQSVEPGAVGAMAEAVLVVDLPVGGRGHDELGEYPRVGTPQADGELGVGRRRAEGAAVGDLHQGEFRTVGVGAVRAQP